MFVKRHFKLLHRLCGPRVTRDEQVETAGIKDVPISFDVMHRIMPFAMITAEEGGGRQATWHGFIKFCA